MSSLGEVPDGVDLGETKIPALVSGFAITWAFALIFVGLRLASRRLANMKLWSDDWLIVVSLVCADPADLAFESGSTDVSPTSFSRQPSCSM